MTKEAKELLARALQLPEDARAALAGRLIASLEDGLDPDADAAWRAEIARRLKSLDDGTAKTIPWSEVERGLLAIADGHDDA